MLFHGSTRTATEATVQGQWLAMVGVLIVGLLLPTTCFAEKEAPSAVANQTEQKTKAKDIKPSSKEESPEEAKVEMQVIGATAEFVEKASGIIHTARIDTGATTCSIHAEGIQVEGGGKKMIKNIGKKVSFELTGDDGTKKRIESVIVTTVKVKTSEEKERRYKVWITLRHAGVERRVHVTLNDRAHMEYPLLIGRNFLKGKFLVDVSKKHSPLTAAAASENADAREAKPASADEPIASQEGAEDKKASL